MAVKKTNSTTKKSDVNLSQFLDEIKTTAYEVYLERQKNNTSGDEMQDWLKAETIIKKKYKI